MYSILAIVACLSAEEGCEVHVLSDPVPQTQCMMWSQSAAAEWAGQHPNYRIDRIMCADPKRLDNFVGRNQA
jgi:hypothetical protein